MDSISLENRRTRTRFLIQLGGLVERSGLLETFGITLGEDIQKSSDMKEPVAALFKGFLVLNKMANSEDVDLQLWAAQGMESFKKNNILIEKH